MTIFATNLGAKYKYFEFFTAEKGQFLTLKSILTICNF